MGLKVLLYVYESPPLFPGATESLHEGENRLLTPTLHTLSPLRATAGSLDMMQHVTKGKKNLCLNDTDMTPDTKKIIFK